MKKEFIKLNVLEVMSLTKKQQSLYTSLLHEQKRDPILTYPSCYALCKLINYKKRNIDDQYDLGNFYKMLNVLKNKGLITFDISQKPFTINICRDVDNNKNYNKNDNKNYNKNDNKNDNTPQVTSIQDDLIEALKQENLELKNKIAKLEARIDNNIKPVEQTKEVVDNQIDLVEVIDKQEMLEKTNTSIDDEIDEMMEVQEQPTKTNFTPDQIAYATNHPAKIGNTLHQLLMERDPTCANAVLTKARLFKYMIDNKVVHRVLFKHIREFTYEYDYSEQYQPRIVIRLNKYPDDKVKEAEDNGMTADPYYRYIELDLGKPEDQTI